MPRPTFFNLVGANPAATVLDNLTSGSPAVKTAISATLNSALQTQLSPALANTPVLANLLTKISPTPADIVAAKYLTVQAFLKQQLDAVVAKDPVMQQAVDAEIAKLPGNNTVGTLLQLDTLLQNHPLFQADVRKAQLSSLLSTSPHLASVIIQADFIDAYTALKGPISDFWNRLSQDFEFKAVVPELQLTLQLAELTLDNVPLVQAIQNLRQQGKVNSFQDLAKLSSTDWTNLLNPPNASAIGIPASIPGTTTQQKTANYISAMMATLKSAFPTTVLALQIERANMPTPTFMNLVGANPEATVLGNLTSGSPAVKTAISATLNSALQTQLLPALANTPVLAGLLTKVSLAPVDIVAAKDLTTPAFLKQQLDPMVANDPAMQQAVDGEIAKLTSTGTIGTILNLTQTLQTHPLFQADVKKASIAALLTTSPSLATNQQLEADFVNAYTAFQGSIQTFWAQLPSQNSEFTPAVASELQWTMQLGALTLNNTPLVQAIQNLRQQGKVNSFQDLLRLSTTDWTNLLNPPNAPAISAPGSVPGTSTHEKTANYISAMMTNLKNAFPTTVMAQSIATQPAIDTSLVQAILSSNPNLNPSRPLPSNVKFGNVSAANQSAARASWEALRKEINTFPAFNYTTLLNTYATGSSKNAQTALPNPIRDGVLTFLKNWTAFDFQTTNINAFLASNPNALNGVPKEYQAAVTDQLKAYQRIYRVGSDSATITNLMGEGFDSARSITSVPPKVFVRRYAGLFGGAAQAKVVYGKAQFIAAQAINMYMRVKEGLSPVRIRVTDSSTTQLQTLIEENADWQNLFGPDSYCQCEECMAVDGPAAYFVDLLQYLGNLAPNVLSDTNSGGYTPLDVLIGYQNNPNNYNYGQTPATLNPPNPPTGRRPDLAYVKLTCANVDTELPYVDLVNEILESYVYYVGMGTSVTGVTKSGGATLTLPIPAESNFPETGNIVQINSQPLIPSIGYNLASDNVTVNLQSSLPTSLTLPNQFPIAVSGLPSASNNTPSDATTDELDVNPAYTVQQVYDPNNGPLATAAYPFCLPYDRYLDTARLYLNNLGVTRAQILGTFTPVSSTVDEQAELAVEVLNSNEYEYELITGGDYSQNPITFPPIWSQYGFTSASWPIITATIASTGTAWTVTAVLALTSTNAALEVSGSPSVGDSVTLTAVLVGLDGPPVVLTVPVTVANASAVAQSISNALNANTTIKAAGISASTQGSQVTIASGAATWGNSLSVVETFLDRTSVKFAELVALLKTQYLNAAQSIVLQADPNAPCDISTMRIVGPKDNPPQRPFPSKATGSAAASAPSATVVTGFPPGGGAIISALTQFYFNLPGFLRLRRRLRWTIAELDQAITAINATAGGGVPLGSIETGRSFVLTASQIKTLQGLLNLSVAQLLSLWSNIGADGRDSLYVQLFQNKAVLSPLDCAFALRYQANLPSPPSLFLTKLSQPTWSDGTPQEQAAWTSGMLYFTGTMTEGQHDDLLAWAMEDSAKLLAIDNLYNQRWMPGTDIVAPIGQSQPLICNHLNTILAALQVSAADLSAIAADCGFIPPGADFSGCAWVVFGGTVTIGDSVTITIIFPPPPSGNVRLPVVLPLRVPHKYAAVLGDTLGSIAAAITAQINSDAILQGRGVSAAVQGNLINVYVASGVSITYDILAAGSSIGSTATETVSITAGQPLDVANLSALYRYAALAQALNLSVSDLISLKKISGINPFAAAATAPVTSPLAEFVKAAQMVQASNFSVTQLNYVYRALPDPADSLPPQDAVEQQLLAGLSAGLQKIAAANVFTPDPKGTALRKNLAAILPPDQLAPAMDLIGGSAVYSTPLAGLPLDLTRQAPQAPALTTLVTLDQVAYITTVTIGGFATAGDVVTLSLILGGVTGPVTLSYTVIAGDTSSSIAIALAGQINNNTTMSAGGISATAAGAVISISSELQVNPAPVLRAVITPTTTPASLPSGASPPAATEQIAIGSAAPSNVVTLGGSPTPGDNVTLTLVGNGGQSVSLPYTVTSSDTLGSIATALQRQITPSLLNSAGITATVDPDNDNVIIVTSPSSLTPPVVIAANTASPPATESVTVDGSLGNFTAAISGSPTPGDIVTLTFPGTGGSAAAAPLLVAYPVGPNDMLSSISTGLINLITGSQALKTAGITASSGGATTILITAPATSSAPIPSYTPALSAASETITTNGAPALVITGSPTRGDVVSLSISLSARSGAAVFLTSAVTTGETLAGIASDFANQIASNAALIAAGITATATGSVLILNSAPSLSPSQAWTHNVAPPISTTTVTETVSIAGSALVCTGPMSDATQNNLLALAVSGLSDSQFIAAVTSLYNQAQDVLSGLYFLALANPFKAILSSLPANVSLPSVPPGQVLFISTLTVGGTVTPGDQLTLTTTMSGSSVSVTIPSVTNYDTPDLIAAKLAVQINGNSTLNQHNISASVSGSVITFSIPTSGSFPEWTVSPSSGATETVASFTGLVCYSPMTNSTRMQLEALSSDSNFVAAVEDLYNQAWGAASQMLIDAPSSQVLADRYNYVFQGLLTSLQATQSRSLVKQTLSQSLGLNSALIALLLQGDPTNVTAALLPSQSSTALSASTLPAMADFLGGLLAFYYSDSQLETVVKSQIDLGVNLDGTEPSFGSAQWFGQVAPPTTDSYTFSVAMSAGALAAQLWVNGQLLIDQINNTALIPRIALQAGQLYDIQLNVLAKSAGSMVPPPSQPQIELQWSNSSISKQTIPPAAFILGAAPASAQGLNPSNATTLVQGGAYAILSVLNRIAVLVNGFSMKTSEVEYFSDHPTDFAGTDPSGSNTAPFDLSALPMVDVSTPQPAIDGKAPALFNQWQRLFNLYKLKAGLPTHGNVGLFDVFQAAVDSNSGTALTISQTILQATGWSATELSILTGSQMDPTYKTPIGFALVDQQFKNEISLVQLAACTALVNRLGASSKQLFVWANNQPDATQAQQIQNTIKAKYSDTAWLQVGASLSNKIRAGSKDALIAYILSMPQMAANNVTDADDLYEYFLIDVQMSTCMQTSRLVQATAAVQLFAQRCLMNLENNNTNNPQLNVSPTQLDATEWEWMQNYRVWQANREVFLYPENWIEPTLRDDRTPFFQDLQNDLLQGPVTDANVEQAYFNYLQKLDEVAQLQIVGLYQVNTTTNIGGLTVPVNTIHIFGRTSRTPHIYYYRTLQQTGGGIDESLVNSWTPWERVDVDIQSDQLIPVVWNNRLYIFWPLYIETADQSANQPTPSNQSATPPTVYYLQVQMAWSEYKQGSWTKKQVTKETLIPTGFGAYCYCDPPNTSYGDIVFSAGPTATAPQASEKLKITPPPGSNSGTYQVSVVGPLTAEDTLTLLFAFDEEVEPVPAYYTVQSGDKPGDVLNGLLTSITKNVMSQYVFVQQVSLVPSMGVDTNGNPIFIILQYDNVLAAGFTVTYTGVAAPPPIPKTNAQIFFFDPQAPTETVTTSGLIGNTINVALSGYATLGDTVALTVTSLHGVVLPACVGYTVGLGDTLETIAEQLAARINALINRDPEFTALGITAVSGAIVSINVPTSATTSAPTATVTPLQSNAPVAEVVTISGIQPAISVTISGSPTAGDTVKLTFSGVGSASYTVLPNDTLATIAAGLANQINDPHVIVSGNQTFNGLGIQASSGMLAISPCGSVSQAFPPSTLPTMVFSDFMTSFLFGVTVDTFGQLQMCMYSYSSQFGASKQQIELYASSQGLSYNEIGHFIFTGYSESVGTSPIGESPLAWPFPSFQPVDMALAGLGPLTISSGSGPLYVDYLDASQPEFSLSFEQGNISDLLSNFTPDLTLVLPFVYADAQRTYFVSSTSVRDFDNPRVQFYALYHPHLRDFIQALNESGVSGLLQLQNQELSDMLGQHFYSGSDPSQASPPPTGYHDDGIVCYLWEGSSPDGSNTSINVTDQYGNSGTYFLYSNSSGTGPSGTVPLYWLQNSNLQNSNVTTGVDFYTTSAVERQNAKAWYGYNDAPSDNDKGIYGYVYDPDSNLAGTNLSKPLYRLAKTDFATIYQPTPGNVSSTYPWADVDFTSGGAYSVYNWELFFHIPLLIATQLSQNQQFEQAREWFHYIFNPTNDAGANAPNSFWNFLPFNQGSEPQTLYQLLTNPSHPRDLFNQVLQYQTNPFDPDAIARLRPVAYQKAVVMAYINNLIAWGDYLFGQNTRDSINEATQIYVLAQQILGPKPVLISRENVYQPSTYLQLGHLDPLSDVLVQSESVFPFSSGPGGSVSNGGNVSNSAVANCFYFCIPPNDQLLGYWDTVSDRLYKIRHCMNIQGQVEQLALFAPPINPALLIAAEAAGVDLSSVLGEINATTPYYRFSFILQKAVELCAEVRSLGGALLSALEKKDAEGLSLLRANQELAVLNAVLQVKQTQVQEANANVQALQASLAVVTNRQTYYNNLITTGLSSFETGQVVALTEAQVFKTIGQAVQLIVPAVSSIPNTTAGGAGWAASPVTLESYGGDNLGRAAAGAAQALSLLADVSSFLATMASLSGQWFRRSQEWNFQLTSANLEIAQINQQINAANFRATIAQEDLNNQNLQIGNASDVLNFLQTKFTNEDLYVWMVNQVSAVYFQCYQLAYGLAKRAEACFRFELGLSDSNYIQFGYWDSLKQGLISGEKLYLDLKRLELAYMDQNRREYEITRSISLVLLDPIALITLKETGQCIVNLSETFFDMDYAGHYMRRIKTVSLTIPCVVGPYTSVNCTLTLVQSKIRWDSGADSYPENPVASDTRFLYNFAASQSIATSTAQSDNGMFELNFRDERYLPFEGAGAISQWLIAMPQDSNAFDFETITDVILNLKYTARDGGAALRDAARKAAVMPAPAEQSALSDQPTPYATKQTNLVRYCSLKHEFPTEWYQFMHPAPAATSQTMCLLLTNERFPFQWRGKKIKISQVQLFLKFKAVYPPFVSSGSTPLADYDGSQLPVTLTPPSSGNSVAGNFLSTPSFFAGVPYASMSLPAVPISVPSPGKPTPWTLTIQQSDVQSLAPNLQTTPAGAAGPFLNPDVIDDLFFVCQYSVS